MAVAVFIRSLTLLYDYSAFFVFYTTYPSYSASYRRFVLAEREREREKEKEGESERRGRERERVVPSSP